MRKLTKKEKQSATILALQAARRFAYESSIEQSLLHGPVVSAYSSNADWLYSVQRTIISAIRAFHDTGGIIRTKKHAQELLQMEGSEPQIKKFLGTKMKPIIWE